MCKVRRRRRRREATPFFFLFACHLFSTIAPTLDFLFFFSYARARYVCTRTENAYGAKVTEIKRVVLRGAAEYSVVGQVVKCAKLITPNLLCNLSSFTWRRSGQREKTVSYIYTRRKETARCIFWRPSR